MEAQNHYKKGTRQDIHDFLPSSYINLILILQNKLIHLIIPNIAISHLLKTELLSR